MYRNNRPRINFRNPAAKRKKSAPNDDMRRKRTTGGTGYVKVPEVLCSLWEDGAFDVERFHVKFIDFWSEGKWEVNQKVSCIAIQCKVIGKEQNSREAVSLKRVHDRISTT